jgi:glycosyltransferase involved in cell wall biosynthesis
MNFTFDDFDYEYYLENNPDLKASNIISKEQLWKHWISFGYKENRHARKINEIKLYKTIHKSKDDLKKENNINIITFVNINCSINENAILLKSFLENKEYNIQIIDFSKINTVYSLKHNIICLQPFDLSIEILSKFKYKPIAFWVWEYKSLPNKFKELEKYFKKIFVESDFCFDIFSKNLSLPIIKIEIKSQIHNYISQIETYQINSEKISSILSKTEGKIRYGYCYDLNSSVIRKNVLNLVKAFEILDTNDNNKVLILKTRPIKYRPNLFELNIINEINKIINKSSNIYLINEQVPILDIYKLYTYFDYYISPHSGEGYGFTIYDNYILGNKIICPYYSGEKDYLKRENIIELDYEEKEIEGLRIHPIYGQMTDFKGAYISIENIVKIIKDTSYIEKSKKFLFKDISSKYILYFVHLTCTQDFNTGIQKIVRDISLELNKKKKVILIKYNITQEEYEIINDNELKIFTKFGGVNHYDDGYTFEKLSTIYNTIKYESNVLIVPEIYYFHEYKLFNKFLQLGINRNYNITHIYYDDSIFYNESINKESRELLFGEYIKNISMINNICSISHYSKKTYLFHKDRLNLKSKQNIKSIQLPIINSFDEIKFNNNIINLDSNIIISNISKTKRKNYDNLIKAFKLLHAKKPNFKLIIFGHEWINNIDIDNNIEYKSFVSDNEKEYLYNKCLFSVYPSLIEGYGLPIFESLIFGKPVICHNETSTLEIYNYLNQPCVSAIDCKDVNKLFEELNKFTDKEFLLNSIQSIPNIKFKTNKIYGNKLYKFIYKKLFV